jgi:single-strand DNA-binding protein
MIRRMGFEINGKLHAIFDVKQVTERFRKREFVVELADNQKYPQYVQFELTGDRADTLEGYSVGDEVKVEFSLRGREWNSPSGETKFFNSLDVWTIERVGAARDTQGFDDSRDPFSDEPPTPDGPPPGIDDIPF